MALTDTQKMKIVTLLGWSGKTLISSSTHYSNIVVGRLTNLSAELEALVVESLASIAAVDVKLSGSLGKAGLKRIGDIEFFGKGQSFSDLKKERVRHLRELSNLLDIIVSSSPPKSSPHLKSLPLS